ncbi:MAG: peptide chain release factor subunit 1 [Pseudonocardiales bacterium]|nr:peptide chain release factor subunit 1 [Pseudonocardiales bacterium]
MITEDQIRRILRLQGDGFPILSLYAQVPVDPGDRRGLRSRVDSLLSEVRPLASDPSVDRDERLSVRADIEHIEEHITEQHDWRPGTLAMFSCSARQIFEEVALPRTVHDRIVLDNTPWVRSLLAVLNEYRRMCVVFVERGEARVWELYQDELSEVITRRVRPVHSRHVPAPNEDRVRNKAEEYTKRHFRDVIGSIDGLFRTEGFDLLSVGGKQHETSHFVGLLPRHLHDRLVGTFTLDSHPTEVAHIRQCAMTILEEYERTEQRRRVADVVETAAAGGRAALGLADCLWAGALAAIDTLLLEDGVLVSGVVCDNCGWMSVRGSECVQCGRQVRAVVDVLDELTESVISEGGAITHVQVPTELSRHLVGAALRFDLPPPP